jgi:hypothetical protein
MALDIKRDQPVRLPNPSAQPFVAALKTARLFAVVFFWITMVSVLSYVVAFILMEWVGLYDAPSVAASPAGAEVQPVEPGKTSAPAEKPAAHPASGGTSRGAWLGWMDTAKAASTGRSGGFFGIAPTASGQPESEEEKPGSGEPAPGTTPAVTPSAAAVPVTAPPAKGNENEGRVVAKSETQPERPAVPLAEQRKRAADHLHVTINILKPLRVVGVLSAFLLGMTLFLYLQIALLGRLSGIRQLTSALFMTLLFLATVLPWDNWFVGIHLNAFYDIGKLTADHADKLREKDWESWKEAMYYLRFFGLPLASAAILAWAGIQFSSGYKDSVVVNE